MVSLQFPSQFTQYALGHLKFQKLELKKEFFLHFDIDLDVEGSMIEQIELIIPWKSLQTDVK